MTSKQRKNMIEGWVKDINPKAILRAADARCGARYAVYVVPAPGDFGIRCTDYLPLEQLEQYLSSEGCFAVSHHTYHAIKKYMMADKNENCKTTLIAYDGE